MNADIGGQQHARRPVISAGSIAHSFECRPVRSEDLRANPERARSAGAVSNWRGVRAASRIADAATASGAEPSSPKLLADAILETSSIKPMMAEDLGRLARSGNIGNPEAEHMRREPLASASERRQ